MLYFFLHPLSPTYTHTHTRTPHTLATEIAPSPFRGSDHSKGIVLNRCPSAWITPLACYVVWEAQPHCAEGWPQCTHLDFLRKASQNVVFFHIYIIKTPSNVLCNQRATHVYRWIHLQWFFFLQTVSHVTDMHAQNLSSSHLFLRALLKLFFVLDVQRIQKRDVCICLYTLHFKQATMLCLALCELHFLCSVSWRWDLLSVR